MTASPPRGPLWALESRSGARNHRQAGREAKEEKREEVVLGGVRDLQQVAPAPAGPATSIDDELLWPGDCSRVLDGPCGT
jgi:hypothetical protein